MALGSLDETALRRSRGPIGECCGSLRVASESVDPRRDHHRLQHGFHRQHGS
jgi:hypothetical protein